MSGPWAERNYVQTASGRTAALLMQFGQTKRYHTEVLLKEQDVAQHTFNVAWLCWLLSQREPSAELLMSALAHDAGERWTGDLPAPVKRGTGLGGAFDALENAATAKAGWVPPGLSLTEGQILKMADALEGAFFCLRELKLGNRLVVDAGAGGAATNFLGYVRERLELIESPAVYLTASEALNYLESEYAKHTPLPQSQ